jgi:hypothetical protein
VGNLIISFLQSGKVIEDIVRAVSETYSLDQNEALIDVLEFKNHLTIVGLLK